MEIHNENRNKIFDAIKAFAIFLVVYCHCISDLGDFDLSNNLPYNITYSFHMPLFFMISGFFFESSLHLKWRDFLLKKSISLLLPCLFGAIVYSLLLPFQGMITFIRILNPLYWPLWFLKGLFLVQLIMYGCMCTTGKICKNPRKKIIFPVVLSMLVYILPFMSVPRVMIPMFWMGFFIRKYYGFFLSNYRQIGIAALFGFIVLFFLWSPDILRIYSSANVKLYDIFLGNANWMDLLKLGYRILIGLMGSIAIIALFHECKNIPYWVSVVGVSTSAIYILQTFILQELIRDICAPYNSILSSLPHWIIYVIVFPLVSSFVIIICIGLQYVLNRSKILSMLIIGNTQILSKNK